MAHGGGTVILAYILFPKHRLNIGTFPDRGSLQSCYHASLLAYILFPKHRLNIGTFPDRGSLQSCYHASLLAS